MKYRIVAFTALLVSMFPTAHGHAQTQARAVDQPGETSTTFQLLTQMSGDGDGHLAGVTAEGDIQVWNGKVWRRVDGQLHQVSMGSPSDLWGVNRSNNSVWRITSSGWQRAPGQMSYVAVAKGGGAVVATDLNGRPYYWKESAWVAYPNAPTPFKQIEIGMPGNVYGIGVQDEIYKWHAASNTWKRLSGELNKISVAADGTIGGSNSSKQSWIRSGADVETELTGSAQPKWVPQESNVGDVYMVAADSMILKNEQNLYIQKPLDSTLYGQQPALQTDPTRPWVYVIPATLTVSPLPPALPHCLSLNPADQLPGTNCTTQITFASTGKSLYGSGGCVVLSGTLQLNLPKTGPTPVTVTDTPSCLTGKFQAVLTNTNTAEAPIGATGLPGFFATSPAASAPNVGDTGMDTDQIMAAAPAARQSTGVGGAVADAATQVAGSALPGLWSDYVGRSYRALAQNGPMDCQPTTFSNRSQYSWVEFRLPAAKAGRQIQIARGSYNSAAFQVANRVWWSDMLFACDASGSWTQTSGDYGSDASGETALPIPLSPYLAYGHR